MKCRATQVLKQYEYCSRARLSSLPTELIDEINEEAEQLEESSMDEFIQLEVTRQLVHMFRSVQQIQTPDSRSSFQRRMDFELKVGPSSIPEAGDGLFIKTTPENPRKSVLAGTVVAMYPGLVHLKEYLNEKSYLRLLNVDPHYLLQTRMDQVIIDARSLDKLPQHPYGLGHKINHCGADRAPNVLQVSYNFPDGDTKEKNFPEDLREMIPNRFARAPTEKSVVDIGAACVNGLVMVALRPIEDGEELLVDYRLNPKHKSSWPSWYQPHSTSQSAERWNY